MTDLLLDNEDDLKIADTTNDLVLGDSTLQHQRLLLICNKGSFKESPTTGVGVSRYLEDEDSAALLREIRIQFSDDGMEVNQVEINDGKLTINASYL